MSAVDQRRQFHAAFERLARDDFSGAAAFSRGEEPAVICTAGFADANRTRPLTAETLLDIGSVAKTCTAAAILRLEANGQLARTQRLGEFFSEIPAKLTPITLHQLMTHSSGLADFLSDDGLPREYRPEFDDQPLTREGLLARVCAAGLMFSPGTAWSYSNTGYTLLAAVVAQVAGVDYETCLREQCFAAHALSGIVHTAADADQCLIAAGRSETGQWRRAGTAPLAPALRWNIEGSGGLLASIDSLHRWWLLFCTRMAPPAVAFAQPIAVDAELNITCGAGCFRRESAAGAIIYYNGSNTFFTAAVRWQPQQGRFLTIVSNDASCTAMTAAKSLLAPC